jgi:endonuclease/exonuclease/phosphatase family metal-dependent hydrolase
MRWLALFLLLLGCDGPIVLPADASLDAGRDAGVNAWRDAGRDGGLADAGLDAGPDGGRVDGGRVDGGPVDGGPPVALRVLALNLHCLETSATPYPSNPARLEAVARFVAAEAVDVLALQEVCVSEAEDALALLTAALERETGIAWSASSAFAHLAWEGTAREARESLAVLAREPIVATHALEHRAQGALWRVTLFATLARGVTVATVHLDHRDAIAREEQGRELAAAGLVHADSLDVILAGDFNARAPALAHVRALGYVDASATLRTDRIDHVYVHRGARFAPSRARMVLNTPSDRVSDHPGILVDLAERAPEPVAVTRIVARVDVGFGSHLFLRGDQPPLSWERGWPMTNVAAREWRFVLTELTAPLAFKTLVDDARWQQGENSRVEPGATLVLDPVHAP